MMVAMSSTPSSRNSVPTMTFAPLTINCPERLNATTSAMCASISSVRSSRPLLQLTG